MCRTIFREKAIVAYHSWYSGENRISYKQRMCMRCWRNNFQLVVAASTDPADYETPDPVECHGCGEAITEAAADTFTTWYRGEQRKDTVIKECPHCTANLHQVQMMGADRLEDRPMAGVGKGGSPLPNPPAFGRDDLPW